MIKVTQAVELAKASMSTLGVEVDLLVRVYRCNPISLASVTLNGKFCLSDCAGSQFPRRWNI